MRSIVRSGWVLCAIAIAAVRLADAGDPAAPLAGGSLEDATSRILAEERDSERRVAGLYRIRASHPQRVSLGLGLMLVRQPRSYDCTTACEFKGVFVQAEPGYSGGQLSLGYANVVGEKRTDKTLLSRVYLGYGVRAALLKTWNGADLTPSNQTRVGVEGDFTVIGINFSLGLFRRAGAESSADPWLVTGGVGWGF